MSFHELLGQEDAKRLLQNALRKDAVSHAYLFTGPAGSGQVKMALTFALAIFCTASKDDACGECLECRKVEHGNHPDLTLLRPMGRALRSIRFVNFSVFFPTARKELTRRFIL